LRTPGGYRRFTLAMLEGIAACSYRWGWYSMDELEFAIGELAMAAYRDTGETNFPG